jgi:hypothetical protein
MDNKDKQTIIRHLISFAITFVATFLLTLYPAIEAGNWTGSIFLGAIGASARGAFKVAWEFALVPLLREALEYAKKTKKK